MRKNKSVTCLGGGIGSVNVLKGLKNHNLSLSVIVSMADEGGSAGRLRRLFNIAPPGDLVSCMSALTPQDKPIFEKLLRYRFAGDRYGKDENLGGHKIGNLIMVALRDITGDFYSASIVFKSLFQVMGDVLPATEEPVRISAKTVDGVTVAGEETIDLGKYNGRRILDKVFLEPKNAKPGAGVLEAIQKANVLIAGPGDLFTTILPVLIVPAITKAIVASKTKKIFIVNIANKPFETKGYSVDDYIQTIKKHLGVFPFDDVVVNNNFTFPIPKEYNYAFVQGLAHKQNRVSFTKADLVDERFPLYHDPAKLAKAVMQLI